MTQQIHQPSPDHSTPTLVSSVESATRRVPGARAHHVAFWVSAVAFLFNMGFSALPTPLYVLYQQRDHFSSFMITVIYAVYAVGVIGSLFLAGHLSDWIGRRFIFVSALLTTVLSAVVFIVAPSLTGLIIARIISGVAVGLSTATATSYMAELHATARPLATATLVLRFTYQYAGPGHRISLLDAVYFTVETVTTVGYGDFTFRGEPAWLIVKRPERILPLKS